MTEAAALGDHIAFYQSIFGYIRAINPDWKIAINPGSAFPTEYSEASPPSATADLAVVFERSASHWDPASFTGGSCLDQKNKRTFGPGPWVSLVPQWDGADFVISSIKEGKYEAEKEAVALLYEGVGVESIVSQAVGRPGGGE